MTLVINYIGISHDEPPASQQGVLAVTDGVKQGASGRQQ
jgi:hypothetical protein